MSWPTCEACGQVVWPKPKVCACGHLESNHDLRPRMGMDEVRTLCFTLGCPCTSYSEQPAEEKK